MADTITIKATLKFERVSGPEVTGNGHNMSAEEVILDALAAHAGGKLTIGCWGDVDYIDEDTRSTYRLVEVDD